MSYATARCTCKTCGKIFDWDAVCHGAGASRKAQEKAKWAENGGIDECPECREARRTEECEKAAEAAGAKSWPELTGSEKQIAWALRIREEKLTKEAKGINEKSSDDESRRVLLAAVDRLAAQETKAAWWIDNRDSALAGRIIRIAKEIAREIMAEDVEAETVTVEETATVAEPENRTHEGVVDIAPAEDCVSASYPKDDAFREVVKDLSYGWDSARRAWTLDITECTGDAATRAAELGNRLLNAGFAVRMQDADILRRAISAEYEPMTYRWIDAAAGQFRVRWGRSDDLYGAAKSLPRAKYHGGVRPAQCYVGVPVKEYMAVLDFAQTYGFRLTHAAQAAVDAMQAATVTVDPAEAKVPVYEEHPLSERLAVGGMIADLQEED